MAKVNVVKEADGSFTVTRVADDAVTEIGSIPGWATWDADQAEQWIADNVTDLASVQTALQKMARLVILQRDVIRALLAE